jgi:hypothetical protein
MKIEKQPMLPAWPAAHTAAHCGIGPSSGSPSPAASPSLTGRVAGERAPGLGGHGPGSAMSADDAPREPAARRALYHTHTIATTRKTTAAAAPTPATISAVVSAGTLGTLGPQTAVRPPWVPQGAHMLTHAPGRYALALHGQPLKAYSPIVTLAPMVIDARQGHHAKA